MSKQCRTENLLLGPLLELRVPGITPQLDQHFGQLVQAVLRLAELGAGCRVQRDRGWSWQRVGDRRKIALTRAEVEFCNSVSS